MKLNLYAAQQWFSHFDISSSISPLPQYFEKIRLCPQGNNAPDSNDTCYIYSNHTVDNPNTILCCCGNDKVYIHNATLEYVVDEFLKMLEFYSQWENAAEQAIATQYSLQNLLNLSQPILNNPILIQDNYFNILAISNNYSGKLNDNWDYNYKNRQFSLESLTATTRNATLTKQIQQEKKAFFYQHPVLHVKCISAPICTNQQRIGTITLLEYDHLFTEWDLAVVDHFSEMIQNSLLSTPASSVFQPVSNCFRQILSNSAVSSGDIERLLALLNWQDSNEYVLYRIFASEDSPTLISYLYPRIQKLLHPCALSDYEQELYVLVNLDITSSDKLSSFAHLLQQGRYHCSVSVPFRNLSNLPDIRIQTGIPFELQSVLTPNTNILSVSDYVWTYLEEKIITEIRKKQLFHPGIRKLIAYDQSHSTSFADTLFCYLSNERNLAKTCLKMHIHRNTLIYRIQKINTLIDCDSNDINIRNYLFYSLKALQTT